MSDPASARRGELGFVIGIFNAAAENVGCRKQEHLVLRSIVVEDTSRHYICFIHEIFKNRHALEPFAVEPRAKIAVDPLGAGAAERPVVVKDVLRKQERFALCGVLRQNVELHAVDGNGVRRAGNNFTYLILPLRRRVGVVKAHPHRRAGLDVVDRQIMRIGMCHAAIGNGRHVYTSAARRTEPPVPPVYPPAFAGSGELGAVIGVKRVVRNGFTVMLAGNVGFGKQEHFIARGDRVFLVVISRRGVYIRGLGKGGKPGLSGEPFAVEPRPDIAFRPLRRIGIERNARGNGLLRKQERLSVVHREDIELHAVDRYRFRRAGNEVRRRRTEVVKLL